MDEQSWTVMDRGGRERTKGDECGRVWTEGDESGRRGRRLDEEALLERLPLETLDLVLHSFRAGGGHGVVEFWRWNWW